MTAFDEAFTHLMVLEGHAFTDDPLDAGGATKFGISALAFPDEDVENLSIQRAKTLYYNSYWRPLRCDEIRGAGARFQLFECAVHMDPPGRLRRSVKIAQGALIILGVELKMDGIIGPVTVRAINNYPYQEALVNLMNGLQFAGLIVGSSGEEELIEMVRQRLPQLKRYLRGWMRRIEISASV